MTRLAFRALALTGLAALLTACPGEDTPPAGITINSFTATPMTVTAGQATTLAWSVSGADSVAVTNVRTGAKIAESAEGTGSISSGPISEATTFTLEAKAGDETETRSVTVMVTAVGAPVVDSFTADPASIAAGESAALKWQTTDAETVTITAGNTTVVAAGAADGEFTVMPNQTTTYTLVATGAGGTSMAMTTLTVTPANPLPQIQAFTASPNPITAGASTTLSWTVVDADTIVITGPGGTQVYSGANGTGTVSVTPAATAMYTLVATNAEGTDMETVSVTVNPPQGAQIGSFTANPTTVLLGQASVLSWSATNADRVEITSAAGTATVSTSLTGSLSVTPVVTTEYTLTAFNSAGNATAMATVNVTATAPAIMGFTANPNPAAIGATTSLSWSVLGADTVRVTRGTSVEYDGALGTHSIQIPVTTTSTSFTLTAINTTGTNTAMVTVFGHEAPFIKGFSASPNPFSGTATVTLSWTAINAQTVQLFQGATPVPGFTGVSTSTTTVIDNGSFDVVLSATSSFRLVVSNAAGSVEETVDVFQEVVEVEPNGDAASALPLPISGAPASGSVNPAGDEDWYAVTVPAGGWIRAWTDDGFGACSVDTFLTLTSTDGVTLKASDDDDGVGACSFIQPGAIDPGAANLAAGTYYVRVRAYSSTAVLDYVLHVEFGPPACGNTIMETGEQCDDGNTTPGDGCDSTCGFEPTAVFVAPGPLQVFDLGAIDPAAEVLTVRIDVTADAYLFAETLTSTTPAGCTVDTRMKLLAADGATLLGEDDADGLGSCSAFDANVDAFTLLTAGTYWLTVEEDGRNAVIPQVFLGMLATPVGQCGNFVVEGTEQCDDGNAQTGDGCDATCAIEAAGVYTAPGQPQTFAMQSISPVGDQDLFRVDVTATSYLRVETFEDAGAGTCPGADTVIRLFDATGLQLGSDDEGGVGSCSLIDPATDPFARLVPGTYWLQVEDYLNNSVIASYDVVFSSVPADVCGNGVLEVPLGEVCDDGNTAAGDGCSATCQPEMARIYDAPGAPMTFAMEAINPVGEQDVYQVNVTATTYLRVETFVDAAAGTCPTADTVIRLFNSTGQELGSDDEGGVGSCSLIDPATDGFARLAPGSYLLRVEDYLNNGTIPRYDIVFSSVPADVCGNGIVEGALNEVCDDGNTTPGDGCNATCQLEATIIAEVEPNGNLASSTSTGLTALGVATVQGSISGSGDQDFYSLVVPAGGATLEAITYTSGGNTATCASGDTKLYLLNSAGVELVNDDDGNPAGSGLCSWLDPTFYTGLVALPAGTYYIRVQHYNNAGGPYGYYMDVRLQ
jgi:cysteine-rich repeat protein